MTLDSVITCPHCATAKSETMPTDACQFFYTCSGCGARLRPKPGDCCVFCLYGSVVTSQRETVSAFGTKRTCLMSNVCCAYQKPVQAPTDHDRGDAGATGLSRMPRPDVGVASN